MEQTLSFFSLPKLLRLAKRRNFEMLLKRIVSLLKPLYVGVKRTNLQEMTYRGISGVFNFDKKIIRCSSRVNTTQSEDKQLMQNIATKKSCFAFVTRSKFLRKKVKRVFFLKRPILKSISITKAISLRIMFLICLG